MSDPAAPPAAADADAGEEMDFVKAAILFMGCLLAGFVVVLFVLLHKRDQHLKALAYGDKNLTAMAGTYEKVKGLLKEYENSRADEVQNNLQTWLGERYKNAGIQAQANQVVVQPWKPNFHKDFVEHSVEVTVKGITRQQAVSFLWSVERMSTKMQTIDVTLKRTLKANDPPESDVWELKASFGYRAPRGVKESAP